MTKREGQDNKRKDYKLKMAGIDMGMKRKKGQVAIFVIIALVIVGVILVLFLPRISQLVAPKEIDPKSYLETCIEPEVRNVVDSLARQGGYLNPQGYIEYDDRKVKYFCYTSSYLETGMVQQPMIKAHFESELDGILKTSAQKCLASLDSAFKSQGYAVSMGTLNTTTTIEPGSIRTIFSVPMTISKGDVRRAFDKFDIEVKSEIYNLIYIAHSITDYEATYGDSETTLYLNYYPDLRIDKIFANDGSKIYRLTNLVTKEVFMFASRSLVWPAGYAG